MLNVIPVSEVRAGVVAVSHRHGMFDAVAASKPAARRVVVWGTGACANDLLSCLDPSLERVAFIDNRAASWGTAIDGTPVRPPDQLAGLDYDRLIIASGAAAEIRADLDRLGLLDERVVSFKGHGDGWRLGPLLSKPTFGALQVGITTRCNLLCGHCPRGTDDSIYSDLSVEDFTRYLEAFDPTQFGTLLVSDFGEVTIVKSFLSYLRAARALGWNNVEFVTNATNGKRELWDTIFGERLAHRLYISLEGLGADYEAVRGFAWSRFAENVRIIADVNAAHGRPAQLNFNAVCMKSNLLSMPDVVDFAIDLGAATLSFVHLNPSNEFHNVLGRPENHLDRVPRADVVEVFREVQRRAAARGLLIMPPEDFPELAPEPAECVPHPEPATHAVDELLCRQPLHWVEVGFDGSVFPCCQMAKRHAMGNLHAQTFEGIWKGDEYRRLLEGLRPGGTPIDVCRTCNVYNGKRF